MLTKYIITFLKSLVSKFGIRDFVFIGIIGLLMLRMNSCNKILPTNNSLPQLTNIEKVTAKDGTVQSTIKQVVLTPDKMKEVTKSTATNLHVDKITSNTKIVSTLDINKENIPTIENDSTITTSYDDSDISIKHTLNIKNKQGNFLIHLTPDTLTFVSTVTAHLFKPDEYKIFSRHTNQLFKDTLGSSYTYKDYKPYLVIGPSVGAYITFGENLLPKFHPMVGITVTFPLITLKRKR